MNSRGRIAVALIRLFLTEKHALTGSNVAFRIRDRKIENNGLSLTSRHDDGSRKS